MGTPSTRIAIRDGSVDSKSLHFSCQSHKNRLWGSEVFLSRLQVLILTLEFM
jgi:hypothetical protein